MCCRALVNVCLLVAWAHSGSSCVTHANVCSELHVQVVYESQPHPDINLYVAPLGGQASDAVMTLNAQAGKHIIPMTVQAAASHQV